MMFTSTLLAWIILFCLPPAILAVLEKKASKSEKVAGVLASMLFSWLGLAGYYLTRILKKNAANA